MANTSHPEFNYQAVCFVIRAMSNMHPGSGSENYGVIDNLVQRDPGSGIPCINASSLKGAIKEQFKHYLDIKVEPNPSDQQSLQRIKQIREIFGGDNELDDWEGIITERTKKERQEAEAQNKSDSKGPGVGRYKFMQADLLSIPVRSNVQPWFNCTAPLLMRNLRNQLELFGLETKQDELYRQLAEGSELNGDRAIRFDEDGEAILEIESLKTARTKGGEAPAELGKHVALVKDPYFCMLVSDYHLPVIARNYLENGESQNLWYEQVLPRDTRLFFTVLHPKGETALFDMFRKTLIDNPLQIGGNASVGYGWCQVEVLTTKPKTVEA